MELVEWQPRDIATGSEHNRFPRLFDRFFDNFWNEWMSGPRWQAGWYPAMDTLETDDAIEVYLELPGMKREDIKISVANNVLTIYGEKQQHPEAEDHRYHRRERTYGRFSRSFTLPAAVDTDNISATYQDGVLTLTLPKVETARPKMIEVKTA